MSDFAKVVLVWIGIPVIGVLISCTLGWLSIKIHKNIENEESIKTLENQKSIEALRNDRTEDKKDGAIEALRNLRAEIQDRVDNTPYTNQLSVDAHKLDIDIINKHIKNWRAE